MQQRNLLELGYELPGPGADLLLVVPGRLHLRHDERRGHLHRPGPFVLRPVVQLGNLCSERVRTDAGMHRYKGLLEPVLRNLQSAA